MKSISLFLLIGYAINSWGQEQATYYDAIALTGYIDDDSHVFKSDAASEMEICKILKNYCPGLPADANSSDIKSAFTTQSNSCYNPILLNYLGGTFGLGTEPIIGVSKSLLSSVGNLNVTNFADGLAKFLVARAKEELNVAFFRQFQEYIKRYPEVNIIFPETYGILRNLYSFQLNAFLPALRAGFQKDLNSFSGNLIKLRTLTIAACPPGNSECTTRISAINTFLTTNEVGRTFVAALIVSDNLVKGNNAAEIIKAIADDDICHDHTRNFTNIIRFSNLISNSLRSKDDREIWVNKAAINTLISNKDAFKIYLGLLYAQNQMEAPAISFSNTGGSPLSLNDLLVQASTDFGGYNAKFKANFKNVGFAAADVSSNARGIVSYQNGGNQGSILIYADYASSISNYLKLSMSFFNDRNPQLTIDIGMFTSIIDDAVNACYDIKSQNYTSLVLHTSNMLNNILSGNYPFKQDYIKYGTFMANIVEADNSDEVKAAIEAAVLPVGSSSIKRETDVNISLNAYLGPMAGMEYLPALEENQWAPVLGITAPVGVAFSLGNFGNGRRKSPDVPRIGCCGKEKGGKSLTLFVPIIDVGALTTFRLSNDSTSIASEVKLANIIAPGLYLYWGLGKGPLSIGAGCQVGPQLREISATEINIDKNIYFRYGINIAVDIPFFNFYTRN